MRHIQTHRTAQFALYTVYTVHNSIALVACKTSNPMQG